MNPVLSLIIATVNRRSELERCLASLPKNSSALEVIVVDQSADRSALSVVLRFQNTLHISHHYQGVPAASSARNLGAVYARGEWVGFTDDDASFRKDTLQALMTRIESGKWDVITGMTCDDSGKATVLPWRKRTTSITRHSLRDTVAESTLFLRRELFLSCGGFDPIFGPGGSFEAEEAIDLLRRLGRQLPASRMRFFPEIKLVHAQTVPYRDQESLRKAYRYARARGACFARHWRHASLRRVASEVGRHLLGTVIFRGRRRQSRIDCLRGYLAGFYAYWQWHLGSKQRSQLS